MPRTNKQGRYPALAAYLQYAVDWCGYKAEPIRRDPTGAILIGCGALIMITFMAGALGAWQGEGIFVVTAFAGVALVGVTIALLANLVKKDRAGLSGVADIASHLCHLNARHQLETAVHPCAGFLLEEAAETWADVHGTLSTGVWAKDGLPAHWQRVRDEIRGAADGAMHEALFLAETTMRQPFSQTTVDEWRERAEVATSQGRTDMHPDDLRPVIKLIRQLKMLAAESRAVPEELVVQSVPDATPKTSANIDAVIRDLKLVVEAERELRGDA